MSNTDSSNSSKNQIFMRIFIFYHEIICCTTYHYYIEDCEDFSRLSPFASWPGLMFDAQWLEQPMSRTRLCFPKDVRAIEVCFTIFALKWEVFNSSYNHTYPKMWACPIYYTYLFTCRRVASSSSVLVHPDQALHHVASDLGLHCLLSPMSPNTHHTMSVQVIRCGWAGWSGFCLNVSILDGCSNIDESTLAEKGFSGIFWHRRTNKVICVSAQSNQDCLWSPTESQCTGCLWATSISINTERISLGC